ncbi:hypothetical protein EJ04DRAFT_361151 [Polyplosphaeria fusca]|uniref:Uncharacterized protein n=1 Tax=Polyplosphaeria fusca TaxID=682080 RepID=A0A9P4QVF7_9PLEO|nr:hypothetical protein EJ04DRAFT_361151 [Polyplosphaeria fusca]
MRGLQSVRLVSSAVGTRTASLFAGRREQSTDDYERRGFRVGGCRGRHAVEAERVAGACRRQNAGQLLATHTLGRPWPSGTVSASLASLASLAAVESCQRGRRAAHWSSSGAVQEQCSGETRAPPCWEPDLCAVVCLATQS